jgi:lipoate-protein ligase B
MNITKLAPGNLVWLGTGVDYNEAWALQRCIAAERADGAVADTLLLLEHASVYTAGRRSLDDHIVGELAAPLVETDRGGQVTYHGPGQLVGYPIVDLRSRGMGPRSYVKALETAILETLTRFGVHAHTEEGLTGVWTGQGKIAAIGVKISRGVTLHGFALNVDTDLSAYEPIVPCGIPDRSVTSMARLLGSTQDAVAVRERMAAALGECLGIAWAEVPAPRLG